MDSKLPFLTSDRARILDALKDAQIATRRSHRGNIQKALRDAQKATHALLRADVAEAKARAKKARRETPAGKRPNVVLLDDLFAGFAA